MTRVERRGGTLPRSVGRLGVGKAPLRGQQLDGNRRLKRGSQAYFVLGASEFQASDHKVKSVSPDGRHRAWLEEADGGKCVVIDGRRGPSVDSIEEGSLRFSPDSSRFVYAAKQEGRSSIVLDGVVGPGYVDIDVPGMTFSPDGRRFAYAACTERSWPTGNAEWRTVIDGVEQPIYTSVKRIQFSPDGARVGYVATDKRGHVAHSGRESRKHLGRHFHVPVQPG